MPCSAETHEPIKDVMVMSATSAKASFNQETEDFQLEIGVPYGAGHVNRGRCEGIDCYGNMSAGLPSGGAAAMSMFLPMYVPFHMGNFRMASTLSKKEIDLRFGRIGRTTVDNGLRGLVEKGDPVFILEVLLKDSEKLNPETMVPTRHSHANFDERYRHADYRCATVHTCKVVVPTKASLIIASMTKGSSILVPKAKDDPAVAEALSYRRRDTTVVGALFRFSLCSILAVAAVWMLFLEPTKVLEATPCFPFFGNSTTAPSIDSVLPVYPKTNLEAFDLGSLACRLTATPSEAATLLETATAIVGRPVTAAELSRVSPVCL